MLLEEEILVLLVRNELFQVIVFMERDLVS